MKVISLIVFSSLFLFLAGCSNENTMKNSNENQQSDSLAENPFLKAYNTPFNVPPFDKISNKHFIPAIEEAIKLQKEEIEAIVSNKEEPTFENTLVAYDNSGELLDNVDNTLSNLASANTSAEIQEITKKASELTTPHYDDIKLNADLFKRIAAVYEKRNELNLNPEQIRLTEQVYKKFVRGGAGLDDSSKLKLREINQKLSQLTLKVGDNILAETNSFQLVIDNKDDLAGLPQSSIDAAAETAKETGNEGKWVFTIQKPSLIPFLMYSDKRELREKMFKAYINKGDNNNANDNKELISEIVKLRTEKAKLLGYKNHAAYVLEENMAKDPETVTSFLTDLMTPALKVAKNEASQLQEMIDKEGANLKLEAWDWWYYAEKLKKEKYDFDEEALRPYFKLENVIDGAFMLANKLYGLSFEKINGIPVYHQDATVYEVKNEQGEHVGVLYTDWFPRESKEGGAWMTAYRKQSRRNGIEQPPVISMVCNFTKPTAEKPSLLSFEEVETLFHEFGHALHGLFSNCTYYTLSGTSVSRDFVELPSQIMENWCSQPEFLKLFAKHYETGQEIPEELITRLNNAGKFNQGFATVEYLAASILDMAWHTLETPDFGNVDEFETKVLNEAGLIPEIVVRYRSTYFSHIFSGGYSAGYYAYIWAEVLDADAFQYFKENGIFDKTIAASFRDNILSKGNTAAPMDLYVTFRGKQPDKMALLKKRGLAI